MYDLPPPVDSLSWSLGLTFDVCLQIGLGKSEVSMQKWTTVNISEECNAADTTARNWKNGESGITDQFLNSLVRALTTGEKYAAEWEFVIRNSQRSILKGIDLKNQRLEYFEVEYFSRNRFKTAPEVVKYLEAAEVISSVKHAKGILAGKSPIFRIPKANKNRYLLTTLGIGAASLILIVLVFRYEPNENIITNIKFCYDRDFSQILNRCTRETTVFKRVIEKVQVSFESTELERFAPIKLIWYRYGEVVLDTTKDWDNTFALDLQYASTFMLMPKKFTESHGIPEGRYNLRFYLGDRIVNEGQFIVE